MPQILHHKKKKNTDCEMCKNVQDVQYSYGNYIILHVTLGLEGKLL